MAEIVRYVRGFLALFIILLLLIQLVPEKGMKKYIRFFSQLVLSLGFLYPLLSVFCDSDAFLEKIQYETFVESLREVSEDTAKLEYMQNDYYLEKYEEAVEQDVYRTAENYVEPYGLAVGKVEVTLSGEYEVETLNVSLRDKSDGDIEPVSIALEEGKKIGNESVCKKLKGELEAYYQLEDTEAAVWYEGR